MQERKERASELTEGPRKKYRDKLLPSSKACTENKPGGEQIPLQLPFAKVERWQQVSDHPFGTTGACQVTVEQLRWTLTQSLRYMLKCAREICFFFFFIMLLVGCFLEPHNTENVSFSISKSITQPIKLKIKHGFFLHLSGH